MIKNIIHNFIKDNYGEAEAENPAYDIDILSNLLTNTLSPSDNLQESKDEHTQS